MKHTLTIILLLIVSAGCKGPESDRVSNTEDPRYVVVKIDDCEYITSKYSRDVFLIHKGNCSNRIHGNFISQLGSDNCNLEDSIHVDSISKAYHWFNKLPQ